VELHTVQEPDIRCGVCAEDRLLVIHNGSLEIGYLVQKYGLRLAAGRRAVTCDDLPLLSLAAHSREGEAYFTWHQWAVQLAQANRAILAGRAVAALSKLMGPIEAELVSDLIHSGITRLADAGGLRWRHQNGTQGIDPEQVVFVGGAVGGPSYLVQGGLALGDALGTISHGSGERFGGVTEEEFHPVVTNLPEGVLDSLRVRFRSADATVHLLEKADLARRVTRTRPLAVIKYGL
jgi:RNA-splicing ligase RtcB